MIQKEMLEYQALDRELNRVEKDLKKNEFYLQSRRYKAMRQECEDSLNKLDAKAAELRSLLATAKQNLDKIVAMVEEYSHEIEDVEDKDELNYISKKLNAQIDALAVAEREIKKILREGEELTKKFDEINASLPKILSAYKKSDEAFKEVANAVKPKINELRKKQAELKAAIDPDLFEKYRKIYEGQKIHPVFVPLMDGSRCGGCRMDMPPALASKIHENGYTVCEHCGRIIYSE